MCNEWEGSMKGKQIGVESIPCNNLTEHVTKIENNDENRRIQTVILVMKLLFLNFVCSG